MKSYKWSKSWLLLVIANLLMPLLTTFIQVRSVSAEPLESITTQLTNTEIGKASTTYRVVNETIEWTIDLAKSGTTATNFGFSFTSQGQALGVSKVVSLNAQGTSVPFTLNSQGILSENTASNQDAGQIRIQLTTPLVEQVEIATSAIDGVAKSGQNLLANETAKTIKIVGYEAPKEEQESETVVEDTTGSTDSSSSVVTDEKTTENDASSESVLVNDEKTAETPAVTNSIVEIVTSNMISKTAIGQTAQGILPRTIYNNIAPEYTLDNDPDGKRPVKDKSYFATEDEDNDYKDDVVSHTGNGTDNYTYYGSNGNAGTANNYDFAIKKYAKATNEAGLYDVFLNVKGNGAKIQEKIDIMLVVDWSLSMNDKKDQNSGKRIEYAKTGVDNFVTALENADITDEVNLGYISYSSKAKVEVPLQPFSTAGTKVKAIKPEAKGFTFTQQALATAETALGEGPNRKIVVLLTDGVPTISYQVSKAIKEDGFVYGTDFSSNALSNSSNTSKLNKSHKAKDRDNSTIEYTVTDSFTATLGQARLMKNKGIEIHGLGIELEADTGNNLSAEQLANLMRKLVSKDSSGDFYYENVSHAKDIVNYLMNKAVSLVGTISEAKIVDPLGAQFNYDDDVVTTEAFGTDTAIPTVEISSKDRQVNVSNLNLTTGQEIQIKYQVRINTETTDFKPDYWYQMNGRTTLMPHSSNPSNLVDFGIPSAKAPGTTIEIKKIWDVFNEPEKFPNISFTVSRKDTRQDGAWETATGTMTSEDATNKTTEWKKEFSTLKIGNQSVYLPKYNSRGANFTYKVVQESIVDGYSSSVSEDGKTITNKQDFAKFALKIAKVSKEDGTTPLSGAKFVLSGGDLSKNVTLEGNTGGIYTLPSSVKLDKSQTYTLTETTAPTGYEIAGPWSIVINGKGQVTVTDESNGSVVMLDQNGLADALIKFTVADPAKTRQFQVKKYLTGTSTKLDNAKFKLVKYTTNWQSVDKTITEDLLGNAIGFQSIKAGYYVVQETVAPTGYQLDTTSYRFRVADDGKFYKEDNTEITNTTAPSSDGFYEKAPGSLVFVKYDQLKKFTGDITKIDKYSGDAIEGVTFIVGTQLDNKQVTELASATSDDKGKLNFTNGSGAYQFTAGTTYYLQETVAPNGLKKLSGYFKMQIAADGQTATVTYNGSDDDQQVTVHTTIGDTNKVTFAITNDQKTPLPSTGGHGIQAFIILGVVMAVLAGATLYVNNSYRRKFR